MTTPLVITKRFFKCPNCNQHEFSVEHLLASGRPRTFGPWPCRQCWHEVWGKTEDGTVTVTRVDPPHDEAVLCLLRLRDLYVVVESYRRGKNANHDWYDYLFHSHSCPINMMRRAVEICDASEGTDPHGIFRFIAAQPDTASLRRQLEGDLSLQRLFAIFQTEGTEAPTNWPESERGLVPGLGALQDAYTKSKAPKA